VQPVAFGDFIGSDDMNWFDRKVDDFIRRIRDGKKPIPIGPDINDPTYWRWFVIPRNRWFNIYLHHFRHDDAEDLHDHRMTNVSFILFGSYYDERFKRKPAKGWLLPDTWRKFRRQRSITIRRPASPHRVVLPRDDDGKEVPCWSLFVGLPHVRNWGFWMRDDEHTAEWVPFDAVVSSADPTSVGYGQNRNKIVTK